MKKLTSIILPIIYNTLTNIMNSSNFNKTKLWNLTAHLVFQLEKIKQMFSKFDKL
jgi:hypothetical protein